MKKNEHRLTWLGAGVLRLWMETQIAEGRILNTSALAREASHASGGPVGPSAPMAIVMGRDTYSPQELSRLLSYFNVDLETVERIGAEEPGWLTDG